jgi:hypothetical protein
MSFVSSGGESQARERVVDRASDTGGPRPGPVANEPVVADGPAGAVQAVERFV